MVGGSNRSGMTRQCFTQVLPKAISRLSYWPPQPVQRRIAGVLFLQVRERGGNRAGGPAACRSCRRMRNRAGSCGKERDWKPAGFSSIRSADASRKRRCLARGLKKPGRPCPFSLMAGRQARRSRAGLPGSSDASCPRQGALQTAVVSVVMVVAAGAAAAAGA